MPLPSEVDFDAIAQECARSKRDVGDGNINRDGGPTLFATEQRARRRNGRLTPIARFAGTISGATRRSHAAEVKPQALRASLNPADPQARQNLRQALADTGAARQRQKQRQARR